MKGVYHSGGGNWEYWKGRRGKGKGDGRKMVGRGKKEQRGKGEGAFCLCSKGDRKQKGG